MSKIPPSRPPEHCIREAKVQSGFAGALFRFAIQRKVAGVYLLAGLFGACLALVVYGPGYFLGSDNSLEAAAVAHDRIQHVTGLNYFVQDDWRLPVYDVAKLGAPEGANIIYTDSIPLLAPAARIYHRVTGHLPDYFRLWILLSMCLQGVATVSLVRASGQHNPLIALGACALMVAMPALLAREIHASLSSHFLLLFSLAAYARCARTGHFSDAWKSFSWIIYPALFIHFYLFVMVWVVYGATLAEGMRRRYVRLARCLGEVSIHAGVTLCLMLLTGYIDFSRDMRALGGAFGHFSMNLLSPFVPHHSGLFGDARITIDATGGQYEGFNYLGAGILLILIISLVAGWKGWIQGVQKHLCLTIALALTTLLAVSNVIYAGPVQLVHLPLVEPLTSLLGPFRSSGRFFWLVAYGLSVGAILISAKRFKTGRVIMLLALAGAVQIADSSYFWRTTPEPEKETVSRLEALDDLLARHDSIYLGPEFREVHPDLRSLSIQLQWLASKRNLPITSAYLARSFSTDTGVDDIQKLRNEKMSPDTLYIFLGGRISGDLLHAFAGPENAAAFFGGYLVSAHLPEAGREGSAASNGAESELAHRLDLKPVQSFELEPNTPVPLDASTGTDRFSAGLRVISDHSRTNAYDEVELFFRLATDRAVDSPARLVFRGAPVFRGGIDTFLIEAQLNNVTLGSVTLSRDSDEMREISFTIPPEAWEEQAADQNIRLIFRAHPDYEFLAQMRRGPPGRYSFDEMEILIP